ncbi:MAG: hypothetical protein R2818_13270 [Flavobacteriales bacterium]
MATLRFFPVQIRANALQRSSKYALGTVLSSSFNVSNTLPETDLVNNSTTEQNTVTGSYDPNDKTARTSSRESDELYFIASDEYIDYTIRFQNTAPIPPSPW